jgi:hypothetical protein
MYRRCLLLLTVFLVAAGPVLAQQPEPVSLAATFTVKPGMEEQFINLVKKYDQPVFEKLMTDGAVVAWGVDVPVLHHPGEPTHTVWWGMPNYAAMDKVLAAFAELEKKIKADDEQRAAEARRLKQPVPKPALQEFFESVDISQHRDFVYRSIIFNATSSPVPAGALPYTSTSRFRVERGRGPDYRQLFEKYDKPIMDKLVADGVVLAYGLDVEDVTSQEPGTRWFWVAVPNLAAIDKIEAAFNADRQRRSEEERATISRQFREVIVAGSSHDDLTRAVMFAVK